MYECESDKRYGRSPLFGYNYSVLLAGDISVGDTVYTNTRYIMYQIMHCVAVPFGKYMCVINDSYACAYLAVSNRKLCSLVRTLCVHK